MAVVKDWCSLALVIRFNRNLFCICGGIFVLVCFYLLYRNLDNTIIFLTPQVLVACKVRVMGEPSGLFQQEVR